MRHTMSGGRPKGRLRAPYRQGDLDGLCGIYSIVNAVRALCSEVSTDDASWLFDHLVQNLPKIVANASVVIANGIDRGVEARLLLKAVRYVANEHDIDVGLRRLPKAVRRSVDIDGLWQAIANALSPTCVAILGLAGRHSHWTVAVAASPQQLRLYDSSDMSVLRRKHCTVGRAATRTGISPAHVFLVRRLDATPVGRGTAHGD